MFDTGKRLEALEQDLRGLQNAYEALAVRVADLDPEAVLLAQQDARAVLREATDKHVHELEAHRDQCFGVLSDEGARIVAEAKEAGAPSIELRKELARRLRLS